MPTQPSRSSHTGESRHGRLQEDSSHLRRSAVNHQPASHLRYIVIILLASDRLQAVQEDLVARAGKSIYWKAPGRVFRSIAPSARARRPV